MSKAAPRENSEFSHKESCPKCGSSDNLARYINGSASCFGTSCGYYELPDGAEHTPPASTKAAVGEGLIKQGEYKALAKRGLSEETCRKWGYQVGELNGSPVQIANYYKDGTIIAQKVRWPNKDFRFLGDGKNSGLYGQHLWRDGGKMLVVTEGELDALSVSQLQGNKWPVVSVPTGAPSAKKALQKSLDWLEKYDSVILMFDNDEAGNAAIEECVALFTPGKVKVARLPLKDANLMLTEGRGAEVISAIWDAKSYRPDGVVSIGDLREKLMTPLVPGLSWPWSSLTEATYGIRPGEMYALGAGTGMGKSEVWKEVMIHLAYHHHEKVGGVFLEEMPDHTVRCLAGKLDDSLYHIPDGTWELDTFFATVDRMEADQMIYLYDHFGSTDYEIIKSRIRYMAVSLECKHIVLDHVTALVSGDKDGDERKQLDYIMTDLASLIRELNVSLYFISHLSTPEGKPHEEGGRVMIKHFRGSRAIGQWSNFMFGLERNQQEENPELRHVSTVRVLKDRYTGRGTGKVFYLGYEASTGRLKEVDNPFEDETPTKKESETYGF